LCVYDVTGDFFHRLMPYQDVEITAKLGYFAMGTMWIDTTKNWKYIVLRNRLKPCMLEIK